MSRGFLPSKSTRQTVSGHAAVNFKLHLFYNSVSNLPAKVAVTVACGLQLFTVCLAPQLWAAASVGTFIGVQTVLVASDNPEAAAAVLFAGALNLVLLSRVFSAVCAAVVVLVTISAHLTPASFHID